jgi:NAD(P) transhydrogenase subunit beta
MSANIVALLYLAAGVLFILALRGLSSPATSRQGNLYGMIGMTIAVLTTLALINNDNLFTWISSSPRPWASGGFIGAKTAREIPMTMMPELVAAFHSLVGLAAVFVAAGALYAPDAFGILADPANPSGASRARACSKCRLALPLAPSPSPARSSPSPSFRAACRASRSFCPCATRSTPHWR